MTESFVVDATVPVDASMAAVWEFLTDPEDTGLSGVVPGSMGLDKQDPRVTEVGYEFTEFFADPDTGEKVPCKWQTVAYSPAEWHLTAETPISGNVLIDLRYSLSSAEEGVKLRRRMETRLPEGATLSDGWYRRLGDQEAAEGTTAKIAARIAEKAAGYATAS